MSVLLKNAAALLFIIFGWVCLGLGLLDFMGEPVGVDLDLAHPGATARAIAYASLLNHRIADQGGAAHFEAATVEVLPGTGPRAQESFVVTWHEASGRDPARGDLIRCLASDINGNPKESADSGDEIARSLTSSLRGHSGGLCWRTQGTPIKLIDINRSIHPPCPAQFSDLTQHQIHEALFLPALPRNATAGAEPTGFLEPPGTLSEVVNSTAPVSGSEAASSSSPSAGSTAHPGSNPRTASASKPVAVPKKPFSGALRECDFSDGTHTNCVLPSGDKFSWYCGRLDPHARVLLHDGTPLKGGVEDVVTSFRYFQALASAKSGTDVAPGDCGPRPSSVFLYGGISDVLTSRSISSFLQEVQGDPRYTSAEYLKILSNQLDDHTDRLCFLIEKRALDIEALVYDENDPKSWAQVHRLELRDVLAFPIFGRVDASDAKRLSPLLLNLVSAVNSGQEGFAKSHPVFSFVPRGQTDKNATTKLPEFTVGWKSAPKMETRIYTELRELFDGFEKPLSFGRDDLNLHIASTGSYLLSHYTEEVGLLLRPIPYDISQTTSGVEGTVANGSTSTEPPPKSPGDENGSMIDVEVRNVFEDEVKQTANDCDREGIECYFRNIWDTGALGEDRMGKLISGNRGQDYLTMIGLFANGPHLKNLEASNPNRLVCVRRLLETVENSGGNNSLLDQLGRDIPATMRDTLADAAPGQEAKQTILRHWGLLPGGGLLRNSPDKETPAQCPQGVVSRDVCANEELTIAYVKQQPWKGVLEGLATRLKDSFRLTVVGVNSKELRQNRASNERPWDVLLTSAGYYLNKKQPTLVSLLGARNINNYTYMSPLDEQGNKTWVEYESTVLDPPLWTAGTQTVPINRTITRVDKTLNLEHAVRCGEAPILTLLYLDPKLLPPKEGSVTDPLSPTMLQRPLHLKRPRSL